MRSSFYVYFTPNSGEIKGISPVSQKAEYPQHQEALIPYDLGIKFVKGEESTTKWFVTGTTGNYDLTQNQLDVLPDDPGSVIAVQRGGQPSNFVGISATAYLGSKIVDFTIPTRFVGSKLQHIKAKELRFFLSKRNDPSNLIDTFDVSVDDLLLTGSVKKPFQSDLKDFSLFTQKEFVNYEFNVIAGSWCKGIHHSGNRINRLVPYRQVERVDTPLRGVRVTYDTSQHSLSFEVERNLVLSSPDDSKYLLIFTKRDDPTIVIDAVQIDLRRMVSEEYLELRVPESVSYPFGLAGFPIADTMTFVKK